MVIFHSYVSVPEGNLGDQQTKVVIIWFSTHMAYFPISLGIAVPNHFSSRFPPSTFSLRNCLKGKSVGSFTLFEGKKCQTTMVSCRFSTPLIQIQIQMDKGMYLAIFIPLSSTNFDFDSDEFHHSPSFVKPQLLTSGNFPWFPRN